MRAGGMQWGPLFGARARAWADTWEGSQGWGTRVYKHVLHGADIGSGTTVLDCGCGAGRFVRLAVERGADVAGIDAASELVEIAARRSPQADLRVGDFEVLPWPDGSFDVVMRLGSTSGENSAISGANTCGIPESASRVGTTTHTRPRHTRRASPRAITWSSANWKVLKLSGMFALSAPGKLEEVLAMARMSPCSDDTIEATVVFPDAAAAVRAFLSAGATALAIRHSGQPAVEKAVYDALDPFIEDLGRVTLPGWLRVVEAG